MKTLSSAHRISIHLPAAIKGLPARCVPACAYVTAVLIAVMFAGCVLSVAPVVPESQAVFDERLLGIWQPADGDARAVITRSGASAYEIMFTEEGDTTYLEARFGSLGGRDVLDVQPAPGDSDISDTYGMLLLPGHLLFVIDLEEDEMTTAFLDPDSLEVALQGSGIILPSEGGEERLILTGGPEDLREALGAYLEAGGALEDEEVWRRARE